MRDRTAENRRNAGRLFLIALLLLVAGCAAGVGDDSENSGNTRHGGFYGGITGGYSGTGM